MHCTKNAYNRYAHTGRDVRQGRIVDEIEVYDGFCFCLPGLPSLRNGGLANSAVELRGQGWWTVVACLNEQTSVTVSGALHGQ